MWAGRIAAVALAAALLSFWGCYTWLEWARPRTPDPAHGFVHRLKGFQTYVYVSASDLALRDAVGTAAGAIVVGVVLVGGVIAARR